MLTDNQVKSKCVCGTRMRLTREGQAVEMTRGRAEHCTNCAADTSAISVESVGVCVCVRACLRERVCA
jgi:hypothetical protein